MHSAAIAEKIQKLKHEIEGIEQANREYRKIKHPGYPAQKVYEDRRIRLVQIQQEIRALLKAQQNTPDVMQAQQPAAAAKPP
jgi:hypothetical protein